MQTTAIVVNYNAGELLAECVRALLGGVEAPRVKVLDNASADGSAERLQNLFHASDLVEVVFNPSNLGFGPAVNAGLQGVDSEYLLVVNPDCRVKPDTLRLLRQALDADDRAGLAGPLVRDPQGRPEKATLRRFPDPLKSLMTLSGLWRLERWFPAFAGVVADPASAAGEVIRTDAVSGACMLIRRAAMAEVGTFDENYALHCEDLDLMYRMHEAGWRILFVPAAEAIHRQGVSSSSRPLWVHRQKHIGMARFFRKFMAANHRLPLRWLVYTGIWLRYLLFLPWVLVRR